MADAPETHPLTPTWEPRIVLQMLVASDDEAQPRGIMDCVDNDGKPYQSAHMAKLVEHARALVEVAQITKITTEERESRLRSALRQVIINAGGVAHESVSDEFLLLAPEEVRLLKLRADSIATPTTIGERQAIAEGRDWSFLPKQIGRLALGDRPSDNECYCSHSHVIPDGAPLYWPQGMGQYDDSDACCLEHAIEQAESDSGWCQKCIAADFAAERSLAIPATNAPVAAQREALVGLLKWADNVIQAQGITGKQKAVEQARAALRQTLPIHGEMREALEERLAQSIADRLWNDARIEFPYTRSDLVDVLKDVARNALQGDGL